MQRLNQCLAVFLLAPPPLHMLVICFSESGARPEPMRGQRDGVRPDKMSRGLRPTSFSVATELKFLQKYTDGETRFSEARDLPE